MSIHPLTLVERLELLVCVTSMALSCGLLVLICAQERVELGLDGGVRGGICAHPLAFLEVVMGNPDIPKDGPSLYCPI